MAAAGRETQGTKDKGSGGLSAVDALVDEVHAAARWFLAAFAGVGAVLIPTLGLAQLGALEGLRLVLALLWLLLGVIAALVAATTVASLIAGERPTLADLASREKANARDELVQYFKDNDNLFLGEAGSPAELLEAVERARTKLRAARDAEAELGAVEDDDPEAKQERARRAGEVASAKRALRVLDQVTANVEAVARFQRQRLGFLARRRRIVLCTCAIAFLMAAFGATANPGKKGTADFDEATVTDIEFRGANLRSASFDGATLSGVSFEGTEIEPDALDGACLTDVTCPDGTRAGEDGCHGG